MNQLNTCHNATTESERERIYRCGGTFRYLGDEKTERVFIKGRTSPAAKTTRCIGNLAGQYIGMIHEPEVITHQFNPADDVFFVIGTDSVFKNYDLNEFANHFSIFSRKENVQKVGDFLQQNIVKNHQHSGQHHYEDFTFIIQYFDGHSVNLKS